MVSITIKSKAMNTAEETATKYGLCTCHEGYTSRGLTAPDCPLHSMAVEEAMQDYAHERVKQAVSLALQIAADRSTLKIERDEIRILKGNKAYLADDMDHVEVDPESILSLEQEVLSKLNVKS
jgi:hypothetical protein